MLINKIEYPDNSFEHVHNEEYFNLNIYPELNDLETEAGILSDIAEAYIEENFTSEFEHFGEDTPRYRFINNHVQNFQINGTKKILCISNLSKDIIFNIDDYDFILSEDNDIFNGLLNVPVASKKLYYKDKEFFDKYFWYYYNDGVFNYSNLICYTMIIKDGGSILETVLTENLAIIDRWCILDTGSTDGTQDVIKRVLKNKKGKLYEEPFVNFKVSRNRCLDLAKSNCKFNLMLDDTYAIRGNLRSFLTEVRGDQFSDSFSLMIQSDDTEYYSNRITKMLSGLRYIHTIHEVITDKNNINVTVPNNRAVIYDHRVDYMEKRTNNRKQFDLQLLFKEVEDDPNDPRALYYIAQTYGCIGDEVNKAKYFEKRIAHPVQGYFQEKIDACFELARTYNFKIDQDTFEPLTNLSEKQWKRCEELYLQAYELDKNRPDGLYFIGIHHYICKNYPLAHKYFKLGFETGYPVGSQYSLKPTLSFHFLPRFLSETSYYLKDYETGKKAAELFLTSSKYNKPGYDSWDLVTDWYKIHTKMCEMGPISKSPNHFPNKVVAIVTDGGWEPWSGKDILTKGMGGSETWVIETARYFKCLSNDVMVVVFCNTTEPMFFEEVGYNPVSLFPHFIANNYVDTVIVSRYPEYLSVALEGHTNSVNFIFHDLFNSVILPSNSKLNYIFGLTEWHEKYIKSMFPSHTRKIKSINYGIDQERFKPKQKIKNSFIYSSFPNRGLVILLRMWSRIKRILPDAVLNIYSDVNHKWSNEVAPDELNEIKVLLKLLSGSGINYYGWVNKETLANAWATADYWLYPCKFEETFCLTALEAAITKTYPITNNLAALSETVNNRGLIIHGEVNEEWQDRCIDAIKNINLTDKERKLEENYQYAIEHSWKNQTKKFIKELEPIMLNWVDDVPLGTKQPFLDILKTLPKSSNILEIGTYAGNGLVEMLKIVPNSKATVIDFWEKYSEFDHVANKNTPVNYSINIEKQFYENTKKYQSRIKVHKGKSHDKLIELFLEHNSFNFIYVDASHKCLDVYFDAMIAWKMLKIGGIMVFDDYHFNQGDVLHSPYEAIEYFKEQIKDKFVLLHQDYRLFIKRIN